MRRRLLLLTVLPVLLGTAAPAAAHAERDRPVRFEYLGETELPHDLRFEGTTVGGLSAISWDRRTGRYAIISDGRSAVDPARLYEAAIRVRRWSVDVRLTSTRPFTRSDGSTFPPTSTDGSTVAPDPEGIAVDPRRDRLAWSSEGERVLAPQQVLADPAVRFATRTGRATAVLPAAPQLHMNPQDVGPRRNQALEGLSFTPDGRSIVSGMEDPLLQDGDVPTPDRGALVRITRMSASSGLPVSQTAYPLEPLFEAGPAGSTNGLSDLVALGGSRYLVVERAFTTRNRVRVFEADASGATDVLARDSLRDAPVKPMRKRLVVDLARVRDLPRVDDVEGITVGPRLHDGRRLVVLVSDDDFSASRVTRFIAFAATGL